MNESKTNHVLAPQKSTPHLFIRPHNSLRLELSQLIKAGKDNVQTPAPVMHYPAIAVCLLSYVSSSFATENVSCDFENNICEWKVDHDLDGPWKRVKHSQEVDLYYPDSSEYFMNLQCHTRIGRCKGSMTSPDVFWNSTSHHVSISFWLLIQSPSGVSPSVLNLGFHENNRSVRWVFRSQAFTDCFGHWTYVSVCTTDVAEEMQLIFEATAQRYDSIGIDDVTTEFVDECEDSLPSTLCVQRPTQPTKAEAEGIVDVITPRRPSIRFSSATSQFGYKLKFYQIFITHIVLVLAFSFR